MNEIVSPSLDETCSKLLAECLDLLHKGAVLIQTDGTILRCNAFAEKLFARTPQIKVTSGKLEFTDLAHQREFQNAQGLATATIDLDVKQELIIRRDDAFLRPIHIGIRLVDTDIEDLYFLFITDLEFHLQINIQRPPLSFA